jgi:hypothetical protein
MRQRIFPNTPEGPLHDLIETVKANIRSQDEHSFYVIKPQFGFQKTRLRGMFKDRYQGQRIGSHLEPIHVSSSPAIQDMIQGEACLLRGKTAQKKRKITRNGVNTLQMLVNSFSNCSRKAL